MITFLKSQTVLIAGSLVDFLVTIVLVEKFGCWYVYGNGTGNLCGAFTLFILSRGWVFKPRKSMGSKLPLQVLKFVLVWGGNLLLSAAGIYLFTHIGGINYIASKLIVSVLLGVTYNYLLMKRFVFV